MKLHLEKEIFSELIEATAKDLNLSPLYVEKDYWVTYILKNLANSKYKEITIFKGGTSLSKAYKLIDRFSEDIDLAIIITNNSSSNQIKNLIKKIEKDIVDTNFQELLNHPQVSKGSQFRKTVHSYNKLNKGNFGHASENIILELNSFTKPYPYESKEINSFIYDFLIDNAPKLIEQYTLEPFYINVLCYKRTFCEKISAIARASYESDKNFTTLKEKIRHFYDIYFLMKEKNIDRFIHSQEFEDMILSVRNDDKIQFKATKWSTIKLYKTQIFSDTKNILQKLDNFYKTNFSELVYVNSLPSIEDIIAKVEILGIVLKEKKI